MAKLLSLDGHRVSPALSLKDARRLAEGTHIDLLMSDIGLPDGEPLELMRELQQRHPAVLGVIISGYPEPEHLDRYLGGGFCEYLVKPINFDTLRGAVQRCAEKLI